MKTALLVPCFAVLLAAPLFAQTKPPTPGQGDTSAKDNASKATSTEADGTMRRFWVASVPGGEYMVPLDRISSISEQTYMTGGFIVHEINVDTVGQALARFYFIETPQTSSGAVNEVLARGKELTDEAGARTGIDADMVVKTPATTHTKCIEYRLASIAELDALYGSVKESWVTGKGHQFTIK